jgi:GNAT superfamily N-acetyltransferase
MPNITILSSGDGFDEHFLTCFKRFYDDLYVKVFPDPNLRETLDSLLSYNDPRRFGAAEPHGFIKLAVDAGADGAERPVGGALYEVYHSCRSVLLSYILVDQVFRSSGIGTRLFDTIIETLRMSEATDPSRGVLVLAETEIVADGVEASEAQLTRRRLSFLEKIGFAGLDCDYVQPPLDPGGARVDNLQMLVWQGSSAIESGFVPAERIAAFLETFYHAIVGERLSQDRFLLEIVARVRSRGTLALTPVGRPRQARHRPA